MIAQLRYQDGVFDGLVNDPVLIRDAARPVTGEAVL